MSKLFDVIGQKRILLRAICMSLFIELESQEEKGREPQGYKIQL